MEESRRAQNLALLQFSYGPGTGLIMVDCAHVKILASQACAWRLGGHDECFEAEKIRV